MSKALGGLGLAAFLITAAPAVPAEKLPCEVVDISEAVASEIWTPEFWKIAFPDKAERARWPAGVKKKLSRQKANCISGDSALKFNLICAKAIMRYDFQKKAVQLLRQAADGAAGMVERRRAEQALAAAEKKLDALKSAAMEEGYSDARGCEKAAPLSCYDVAIMEHIQRKGAMLPEQEAELYHMKNSCTGGAEPPADFAKRNPGYGPPRCHKPNGALQMQERNIIKLREAVLIKENEYAEMQMVYQLGNLTPTQVKQMGEVEKESIKAQGTLKAAERNFEALYKEADKAECLDEYGSYQGD